MNNNIPIYDNNYLIPPESIDSTDDQQDSIASQIANNTIYDSLIETPMPIDLFIEENTNDKEPLRNINNLVNHNKSKGHSYSDSHCCSTDSSINLNLNSNSSQESNDSRLPPLPLPPPPPLPTSTSSSSSSCRCPVQKEKKYDLLATIFFPKKISSINLRPLTTILGLNNNKTIFSNIKDTSG
jgi:hypothetical protein